MADHPVRRSSPLADCPVRESIREIDDNSWLIGSRMMLRRTSLLDCTWQDGNGAGFVISDAPFPLPEIRPLSDTSDIKLVHDAGDTSAVFSMGDAFCKVKILRVPEATREQVTLAWIEQRQPSFAIPRVLYYAEYNGRHYMVVSRVPGATIDKVWPTLDKSMRQYCMKRIAEICKELAAPAERNSITGVDGNFVPELYLTGAMRTAAPTIYVRPAWRWAWTARLLFFLTATSARLTLCSMWLLSLLALSTGKSRDLCPESGSEPTSASAVGWIFPASATMTDSIGEEGWPFIWDRWALLTLHKGLCHGRMTAK